MARNRRRSSRLNGPAATPEPAPVPASPSLDASNSQSEHQDDDKCPACEDVGIQADKVEQESWVRCDACRTWFHWRCAGEGDLESIDKWCVLLAHSSLFLNIYRGGVAIQVLQVLHDRG